MPTNGTTTATMKGNRSRERPAYRLLDAFVGKWINEGHTIPQDGEDSAKILTSDIYEWAVGGFFLVHTTYGRMGDRDGGGMEIITYDADNRVYRSHFFGSDGDISTHQLTVRDGVWTWAGETKRCTATFTADGKTQEAQHESSLDGHNWKPSMTVTLTKIV